MTNGETYNQAPYRAQWQSMYPGQQYPTPQKYPHMFPEGSSSNHYTQEVSPLFPQCTAQKCPRGIIDYRCQLQNSCYLKLLQLGAYIILTLIVVAVLIAIFTKLLTLLYHIVTGVETIKKIVGIFAACLSCLSLGMFQQPVAIVEVQRQIGGTNAKGKKINEKLKQLNIEVNVEALDKFQIDRIAEILSDYEIESQGRNSTQEKQ